MAATGRNTIRAAVKALLECQTALILLAGLAVTIAMPPDALALDKSLGSATSPDGKVRIDILSLQRTDGDTVTLRWQVTNESNDNYTMVPANMHLVDLPGRRSYTPGITSNICNTRIGQQLICYAVFGAPPATTKTMTVQFNEKLDLISGVPVSE